MIFCYKTLNTHPDHSMLINLTLEGHMTYYIIHDYLDQISLPKYLYILYNHVWLVIIFNQAMRLLECFLTGWEMSGIYCHWLSLPGFLSHHEIKITILIFIWNIAVCIRIFSVGHYFVHVWPTLTKTPHFFFTHFSRTLIFTLLIYIYFLLFRMCMEVNATSVSYQLKIT